jgi:HEPN superfamily RiboL-PSP-like protein
MPLPAGYPAHVRNLVSNGDEIYGLIKAHAALTGVGPGRRRMEVLNKSGIVLLVATWEAYIEDLATAAFSALMTAATKPSVFPKTVLVGASKPLRADLDESKVWELCGDGWKSVLENHRTQILEKHVGKLNTPKPANINELFEKLIGLKNMNSCWGWKGTSVASAGKRLENLVQLRGEIAHRVKASSSVKKAHVLKSSEFISRLAACSSNHVRSHIHSLTGINPWVQVTYRGTR